MDQTLTDPLRTNRNINKNRNHSTGRNLTVTQIRAEKRDRYRNLNCSRVHRLNNRNDLHALTRVIPLIHRQPE